MFQSYKKIFFNSTLFIFILAFMVYFSSFWNNFVWDDEQFIYKNEYVKSFAVKEIFTTSTTSGAGINSNYYRPLTTLSFAIDYQIWSLNELGFHLTNTFLHAMAGVFLLLFLREIQVEKKIAFLISVLFVIHPLQTEAVTYINSRGDSMYAMFVLIGLWLFAMSFRKKIIKFNIYDREFIISQNKLLLFCFFSFLLAIFSKEIALASGGLFFLTFIKKYLESENAKKFIKINYQKILLILILFFTSVFYLFFRIKILNFSSSLNFYQESNYYADNLHVRILTFLSSAWDYLRLFFLPYPLYMERVIPIIDFVNLRIVGIFILLLIIIAVGIFEFLRTKQMNILFGLGWFIVMMIPVSGIVPINGLFYEHWLYLSMVGLYLISFSIYRLFFEKINYHIFYIYALIFITLTIRQNYIWGEPIRFYEHTLQYSQSARLYNNLGMAYADTGDFDNAIKNYQLSLQIDDNYPQIYHNLGNTYLNKNDLDMAENYFQEALKINQDFYFSYYPLLSIYLSRNDYEKAKIYANKLLVLSPNNQELLNLIDNLSQSD